MKYLIAIGAAALALLCSGCASVDRSRPLVITNPDLIQALPSSRAWEYLIELSASEERRLYGDVLPEWTRVCRFRPESNEVFLHKWDIDQRVWRHEWHPMTSLEVRAMELSHKGVWQNTMSQYARVGASLHHISESDLTCAVADRIAAPIDQNLGRIFSASASLGGRIFAGNLPAAQ